VPLERGDQAGIRPERFRLGAGRRHDDHLMALRTQGADHFFDVDVLAVLRAGPVVIENFHKFEDVKKEIIILH
jgi:hypothetical protein